MGFFLSCVWVALASWVAGVLRFDAKHTREESAEVSEPVSAAAHVPRHDDVKVEDSPVADSSEPRLHFLMGQVLSEDAYGILLIDPVSSRLLGANPKAHELLGVNSALGDATWFHELSRCNISQGTIDLLKATLHNADRTGDAHCNIPTSKGNYHFRMHRVGEGEGRFVKMGVDLELVPITRELHRLSRGREDVDLHEVGPLDRQPFSSSSFDQSESSDESFDDDSSLSQAASLTTSMTREIGNISHDLRTPMVSLRGYMEIMSRGDLGPINENQTRCLQMSLRSLDRMVIMVENLLEYSKMSQGERSVKIESFNLSVLTQDILELCQARAQKSNVDLALRSDLRDGKIIPIAEKLLVSADRIKFQRLLTNLVDNALKFTPSGGKIRVYARPATTPEVRRILRDLPEDHPHHGSSTVQSTWLSLRVQDTGCGIPQDHLSHIFERSFTISQGLPTQEGSGFGLAIVDNIVQLHDGIIEVQSQQGVGTVFSLWLPILRRYKDRRSNPTFPPMLSSTEQDKTGTIFVLDDDLECANFARFALQRQGYTVHVATSPIALCEKLTELNVDLLLLDYTLPGYNGAQLLEEIRSCDALQELPVLIISGHTDESLRRRLLQTGAHGFLTKPYTIDDLTATVSTLVRSSPNPKDAKDNALLRTTLPPRAYS